MKILVAYRGTNIGQDLLKLASLHAKGFDAKVLLITSLSGGDKTTKEVVVDAEQKLDSAKATLDKLGVSCETHVLIRGRTPGEDIVSFATENGCEEIIIGVKSRSKVGKILFGSTTQFVILKADCPVVSVK